VLGTLRARHAERKLATVYIDRRAPYWNIRDGLYLGPAHERRAAPH